MPTGNNPRKPSSKGDPLELLPLARLAAQLPAVRGDRRPNRSTLYRWATAGLRSRSGKVVKLAAQFVGGTLCSTMADIERFFAAKNDVAPRPAVERPLTAREQADWNRRVEDAKKRLRRFGFNL